ncbi:hypothetical protein ACWDX6_06530 [Streptomyces sp. NPDC003027]
MAAVAESFDWKHELAEFGSGPGDSPGPTGPWSSGKVQRLRHT